MLRSRTWFNYSKKSLSYLICAVTYEYLVLPVLKLSFGTVDAPAQPE
jgi:hypothetical protein